MKNLSKLLTASLCICLMIITSACKKKEERPVACIGTLPDTTYVNIPVHFSSCSQGNTTVQWHFGDSSVVLGDTVSHTYTRSGTYHGTMYASTTDIGSSKDFTIVVLPDTPGYYKIGNQYYRLNGWANNPYGTPGQILVYGQTNISFYFYPGNNAPAGAYDVRYGYVGPLTTGQMVMGIRLDPTAANFYSSSASNTNKVNLDLSPSGKRHIYGSDIWMVNFDTQTDSFQVSFDLREP